MGFAAGSDDFVAMVNVVSDLLAPGVWHIGLFIVETRAHGNGMARSLMRELEQWAVGRGANWLRLGVVEGNSRAERFWEKCGFVEVRRREGLPMGTKVNTVRVMVKPLAAAHSPTTWRSSRATIRKRRSNAISPPWGGVERTIMISVEFLVTSPWSCSPRHGRDLHRLDRIAQPQGKRLYRPRMHDRDRSPPDGDHPGLAAVIHTSAMAFRMLKYAGAVTWYTSRSRPGDKSRSLSIAGSRNSAAGLVVKAFLLNILNPKLTIFFLAFLPQFIDLRPTGCCCSCSS